MQNRLRKNSGINPHVRYTHPCGASSGSSNHSAHPNLTVWRFANPSGTMCHSDSLWSFAWG